MRQYDMVLYSKKNVRMVLVLGFTALPFFRLTLPSVSYCYNSPLTCLSKALQELAKLKLKEAQS